MIIMDGTVREDGFGHNTRTLPLVKALLNNNIAWAWNLRMTIDAFGTPLVTSVAEALEYSND